MRHWHRLIYGPADLPVGQISISSLFQHYFSFHDRRASMKHSREARETEASLVREAWFIKDRNYSTKVFNPRGSVCRTSIPSQSNHDALSSRELKNGIDACGSVCQRDYLLFHVPTLTSYSHLKSGLRRSLKFVDISRESKTTWIFVNSFNRIFRLLLISDIQLKRMHIEEVPIIFSSRNNKK